MSVQVFIKTDRAGVEVLVTGVDSRQIASAETYLKGEVEDWVERLVDEHPRVPNLPRDLYYTGFSVEEEDPKIIKDVVDALRKEAKRISWVEKVEVGRRWPRFASQGDLRNRLIRLAHEKPELRPHLLPILKTAGKTFRTQFDNFLLGYTAEVRSALEAQMKSDGFQTKAPFINSIHYMIGDEEASLMLHLEPVDLKKAMMRVTPTKGRASASKRDEFWTPYLADFDPRKTAAWVWKNLPESYK
jgi:hypothetical protein